MQLKRKGLNEGKALTTLPALSKNMTSILKRIKKEWIQLEGLRIRASPFLRELRLSKPTRRLKKVSAIFALSARRVSLLIFTTLILFKYIFG